MNRAVQRYNDEMAARYANPSDAVVMAGGRAFTRNHPKVCPWCGVVFYAYKPDGADWPAFKVDPQPKAGDVIGARDTCGHPNCFHAEERHQFLRKIGKET